jgi:hypothetical protein
LIREGSCCSGSGLVVGEDALNVVVAVLMMEKDCLKVELLKPYISGFWSIQGLPMLMRPHQT